MNARTYFLATVALAAVACLASAAPASACEAAAKHHHPAASGSAEASLDIERAQTDLPKALGERGPQTLRVDLETLETTPKVDDGDSY